MMERALNRLADHAAAAEVRAQVRAVRVQHRDASARRPESHELAPQDALRQRPLAQLPAFAEQVPRRRAGGESVRRGSLARTT